jgi:hypothetical protein
MVKCLAQGHIARCCTKAARGFEPATFRLGLLAQRSYWLHATTSIQWLSILTAIRGNSNDK